ncbi:hypothetical protein EDB19DRAFT_1745201 [Suillus lakei]|nr:hypothetical protein EDB19DRAFT_1745201 [Suillus lakei]
MSTVSAELVYFAPPPDGSRPARRARNWEQEVHTVEIENVRGKESNYTLDTAGFQYLTKASKHKQNYYPESIELLKDITGASKVVLFDHTVRRHRPGDAETDESKRPACRSGSSFPDHQPLAAHSHPAIDHPLALCDYRTVDVKEDLVPVTLVYPDREGETFGVKFNPAHRWKYERGMKVDEVVLIKCYDSIKDDKIAKLTPHTGFKDPSAPQGASLRESIELRALVFYE